VFKSYLQERRVRNNSTYNRGIEIVMQKINLDDYITEKKIGSLSSSFNSKFIIDYLNIFTLSILTQMLNLIKQVLIKINKILSTEQASGY